MAERGTDLIPVVQRSYDLCAGLYGHVNRFPRAQRPLLGRMILEEALQVLAQLTIANRIAAREEALQQASGRLDTLRLTLRLSKQLGFLSNGGYEDMSRGVDEIGRMLGGWVKYEARKQTTPESSPAAPPAVPPALRLPQRPRPASGVRYTMTSPTVERYMRVKLEHPQAIVFVTVGVFCQTFFEDATFVGQTLHFAVRDLAAASEREKIPTCGLPKAKLEKYISLLRQAGREVHVE